MKPDRRMILKQLGCLSTGALLPGLTSAWSAEGDSRPPRIKIGQVGVGHAHASKLSVYRESDDFEVVGIVEPRDDLRRRAESQEVYRDLPWLTQEQLLNVPGLQAVLVETEVHDLLPTAEACVAAGKHIHLDKPAGESLSQLRRILDSANRQKLLVQMGYMHRYNPAIVLLRQLLKEQALGDVFEVHAVMSKVVAPDSRLSLARYRGGMMFELGCHLLDLVIGAFGKPVAVASFNQHSSPIDDTLVDNMLAVLTYPRATATVRSSAMEVEGFTRRQFVVCGTEGTFQMQPLDNPTVRIAMLNSGDERKPGYQEVAVPRYNAYVADAADMAQIIRGEKRADFSSEHDLTVQATLLEACQLPID